jgi:formamidopyrimidine-DNA glycosylase
MPELPEVQTVTDELIGAGLVGRTVVGVTVYWARSIAAPRADVFAERLKGERFERISRRGKFIVCELLSGASLLIHLRMTGRFHLVEATTAVDVHDRIVVRLDDGRELRYHDTRKFGRWYYVADSQAILGQLGLEPLDPTFTVSALARVLVSRKRLLKPLLLDQTLIAGLGNIYVDEALWEARLHPCRHASELTREEITRLHHAIRSVLRRGIRNMGTTLGTGEANFYSVSRRSGRNRDRLRVFRRTGQPCQRCGTPIERTVVGQRSTHLCPRCQKCRI